MATATLIPSGYTGLSNLTTSSSYPITNGYTDTDSTTYARLSLSTSTTGYLYFTFDTSDIPSTATITSITGRVKVRVSSTSRVTSTVCQLYSGTTAKGSNVTFASTASDNIVTLTPGTGWTRSDLGDLRLRIGGTGSSSSQSKYIYFYGAEIVVTYTTVSRTVTTTLSGSGTIVPSGATSIGDGEDFTLTITPDDKTSAVTATKNGTDITSALVAHYPGGTLSTVLGTYSLVSGGFNGSGSTYFQGIVGNGVDAAQTTSNYYSSGSGTTAVFQYSMAFTDIPANATIERVYCEVNGHAESTSNSSEYMCVQLKSGSTELSEEINFKSVSTNTTTITLEATTIPTAAQLANMVLECTLGYYGGAINGATCYVVYSVPADHPDYYTYTYVTDGDATIAVVISGAGRAPVITIGTPSTAIISDETGYDECICTFTADVALQAWEARATKSGVTPARGVGLLVESGGSLAAGTAGTVSVVDEELTDGDGDYTITVYGQSTGGIWSQ